MIILFVINVITIPKNKYVLLSNPFPGYVINRENHSLNTVNSDEIRFTGNGPISVKRLINYYSTSDGGVITMNKPVYKDDKYIYVASYSRDGALIFMYRHPYSKAPDGEILLYDQELFIRIDNNSNKFDLDGFIGK